MAKRKFLVAALYEETELAVDVLDAINLKNKCIFFKVFVNSNFSVIDSQ